MKLAFSRPTAEAAQQRALFDAYRGIGYDGLQLKGGQYGRYLDDAGAFAADWGEASGVIAGGALDDAGVASLRKVFSFAEAVGTELVIFCPAGPRDPPSVRALARRLSDLGREALARGTKLSIHNHHDSPLMGRDDFDTFFEAADGEALGLTLDTAHAVKSGIDDVAALVCNFAGVIDNFHLKDFADGQWRVLGEGGIDFEPIFQAIIDVGYDGWVATDEESGGRMLPAMKSCLAFMRHGLRRRTADE